MTNIVLRVLSATLDVTVVGCASTDPMKGSTRNAVISVEYGRIEYGRIENVEQVAMAPNYGAGAVIGGAEKFTVRLVNNSTIDIVTENQGIQLGDCVSIEQGQHANIRRVSSVMCSTPFGSGLSDNECLTAVQESAECQTAKQELLQATTTEQTDISYKKMRAFCES